MVERLRAFFVRHPRVTIDELREMSGRRQFRECIEAFQKRRVENPQQAHGIIGFCFFQLTNYELAVKHLELAVKANQEDYYSYYFLGLSYRFLHKDDEAISSFLQALALAPQSPGDVLGQLLPMLTKSMDVFVEHREVILESLMRFDDSDLWAAQVQFFLKNDEQLLESLPSQYSFNHFFSAHQLADKGQLKLLDLGEPEKLRFYDLENKESVYVDTSLPYVAELASAKIFGGSTLVVTANGEILSDVLGHDRFGRYADMQYDPFVVCRRDDALLTKNVVSEKTLEKGIMLSGFASSAYGHWFAEFLPKLRFYEQHPEFNDFPIIVDEGMPQSHYDFLESLVGNRLVLLKKGQILQVSRLLVAPADTFFPVDLVSDHKVPVEYQSSLTEGALRYLGDKIKVNIAADGANEKKRIFLARKGLQWRRLINEDEIKSLLEPLGFQVVHIEDYTFYEQVRLFRDAEFIVAPNGSALNNLIFSDSEVKVLMLGQKQMFNWGGWFGSFFELGYQPKFIAGEASGDKNHKHLDYSIDQQLLLSAVRDLMDS